MKILFLSQRFLLPMDTGGKIRTGNILKHLSKKHHITLISNVESPKDDPFISQIHSLCADFIPVPWKEVKRHSLFFWGRLALQMFSVYPVNVLNDYSRCLRKEVEKACRESKYDLVVCDFVQSALMFQGIMDIPSVLFQHNVESMILVRHLENAKNPILRLFWWLQWRKMAWFEKNACRKFDKVIAVSIQDKKKFEKLYGLDNVDTIPTGVDIEYFQPMPQIPEKKHSLVFCGSMDWLPNEDAMVFFIGEIFSLIKKHIPDVTLTIVGRNPSPILKHFAHTHSDVVLTGWVDDTRPYIAQGSVVIVPIRIGGGTRMKIYAAMAMGKPIISTTIGAEGLPVSSGETIIIEDQPNLFAEIIVDLLKNSEKRKIIGTAAGEFVRNNFSWKSVGEEFSRICQSVADQRDINYNICLSG